MSIPGVTGPVCLVTCNMDQLESFKQVLGEEECTVAAVVAGCVTDFKGGTSLGFIIAYRSPLVVGTSTLIGGTP